MIWSWSWTLVYRACCLFVIMRKSKSKSKKTLFQVGTETNKNISSYLKISASHRPESWAMYNIYNMVKCKNI